MSILQPIDSHLKNFLNKKNPELQARDAAAWWGVHAKLKGVFNSVKSSRSSQSILHLNTFTPNDFQFSGLLRKAAKALFLNDEFTKVDHVT